MLRISRSKSDLDLRKEEIINKKTEQVGRPNKKTKIGKFTIAK